MRKKEETVSTDHSFSMEKLTLSSGYECSTHFGTAHAPLDTCNDFQKGNFSAGKRNGKPMVSIGNRFFGFHFRSVRYLESKN